MDEITPDSIIADYVLQAEIVIMIHPVVGNPHTPYKFGMIHKTRASAVKQLRRGAVPEYDVLPTCEANWFELVRIKDRKLMHRAQLVHANGQQV